MQSLSDGLVASRSPDVHGRHSASAPRRWLESASPGPSTVLTDLSTAVSQVRSLQQLSVDDDDLNSQLSHTAAELESLIIQLRHTDVAASSTPPAGQPSPATPHQQAAEQAFLVWLAELSSADELALPGGDDTEPLALLLGELSLSRRVLPDEAAARIGLPGGTTVGHAAADLLLAVKDPAGPRCRSFRAAVYYLQELDRGRFLESDDGKICR